MRNYQFTLGSERKKLVLPNDLLVFILLGQSNAAGHPISSPGIGTVPAEYEGALTSEYFINNAHWSSYVYNPGSFGPDVGMMHKMDSLYPGQIRLIKWAVGGTRLRVDTRPLPQYDWNVNSVDENWDRAKEFSIGEPGSDQAMQDLQNDNPGKNIRIVSVAWLQGEADASLDTGAGDDAGMTGVQAKTTYKTDLTALFGDIRNHLGTTLGFDLKDLSFDVFGLNSGASVVSRSFYSEINEALKEIAESRVDSEFHDTLHLDVFDGTHYGIKGQLDLGTMWALGVNERL